MAFHEEENDCRFDEGESEQEGSDDEEPLEPPHPGYVRIIASPFRNRPGTVFFDYPASLGKKRGIERSMVTMEKLGSRKCLFWCQWERVSVNNAFVGAGFRKLQRMNQDGKYLGNKTKGNPSRRMIWNACWTKHLTLEGFKSLTKFQKVNHFPGSWCIGRKDRLLKVLMRQRKVHGKAYDFFPEGFILPMERNALKRALLDPERYRKNAIFVVKPPANACGRGISIHTRKSLESLPKEKKVIVQRYIQDPLLIDDRKWDLRLYVLVTSFDPLRAYLFKEGLARFASYPYSPKNLKSKFSHLTNFSVNRKSKHYKPNVDAAFDCEGSKWSLSALWRRLAESFGHDEVKDLQEKIIDIIIKTLIAGEEDISYMMNRFVRHRKCCYELFGFDILLDKKLKPWLLEVNVSPSLMGSSPLDKRIKGTLMADIFHLVGFTPYDSKELKRETKAAMEAKVFGVSMRSIRRQDEWRRGVFDPSLIASEELTVQDMEVIYDLLEENDRLGHFESLYPLRKNVLQYLPFFSRSKFFNCLYAKFLLDPTISTRLQYRQDDLRSISSMSGTDSSKSGIDSSKSGIVQSSPWGTMREKWQFMDFTPPCDPEGHD